MAKKVSKISSAAFNIPGVNFRIHMIDTKRIDRRALRYDSLDAFMTEVESVVDAEQAGNLRSAGNWTAGQIFGHLATWIDYGFDGLPFKPPVVIKVLLRVLRMKNRFVNGKLPAGVKIPRLPGGTLGREEMTTQAGLLKLRAAVERLKANAPDREHPIFGWLTHDEWIKIHLRHDELHLGFLSVSH